MVSEVSNREQTLLDLASSVKSLISILRTMEATRHVFLGIK